MTLGVRPTNLPPSANELIGRREDLERVAVALAHGRLVTLTGRGGTGKTSLALAAASDALEHFPGGVWWVALAATTADRVLSTIAAAVHAEIGRDDAPLDALVRRFDGRGETLLVLDNLEHLLEIGPQLVQLVERAPEVRILATSQAPLRIAGEVTVLVEPLTPAPALALFDRIVARVRVTGGLRDDESADASEICRRLDGLPLAIELAAGRVSLLTVRQLRERVEASLRVVSHAGMRADRQRSLRGDARVDA